MLNLLRSMTATRNDSLATGCRKLPELGGDRKVTVGVGKWW
jgi:hypothetical protein